MGIETGTALLIGSLLAGGASIYGSEKSAKGQREALRKQEQAQKKAEGQALDQKRQSEQAMNKANAKTPNISSIMATAMGASRSGSASTLLSGQSPNSLGLARTRLLGE